MAKNPSQNFFETQRTVNQLINGAQTPLLTTVTCYNNNNTNCATASVASPIIQTNVTVQYPGAEQATHTTTYSSGLPTNIYQYSYVSSGTGTLLRHTQITYANLGNNIGGRPSQVTVTDGSLKLLSQTNYAYDEASYPIQTTSGTTPQHTTIAGARGNVTTITNYSTSTLTLSRHFQY